MARSRRCAYAVSKVVPADLGRYQLELGAPSGGLLDCLPSDISLYHQSRGSEMLLTAPMSQRIELRIKTQGLNMVYYPDTARFMTDIGASFFAIATLDDDQLIVITECTLEHDRYEAAAWPDLRSCLVQLTSPATRTLLWKLTGGDE